MGTVTPIKRSDRASLEAALAALVEEDEAEFVEAVEAFERACRVASTNPGMKPGIRNIARVLSVHVEREGLALKSIRGGQ